MARKYFRGGANVLRGSGSDSHDGDWDYDNSGGSMSNWILDTGAATTKPGAGDEAVFSEFACTVPANYSTGEPHIPGKHFCCCHNMGQGSGGNDITLNGLTFTPGYDPGNTGGLFYTDAANLAAIETDSADSGASTKVYCTNSFAVGDYVTIAGTIYLNGEFRISACDASTFTIPLTYIVETPPTTATATVRRPLRIGIAAGYIIDFRSNCTAYIEASHDSLNVEKVVFDSVSGLLHLSSDVVGYHNYNEIRAVNNGTLNIAMAAEFTKLIVNKDAVDCAVVVGKGCLGPSAVSCDLDIDAGNIAWNSKMGDVEMNGGKVVYCQSVDVGTSVDIDKIVMRGDGEFEWYGKSRMYDLDMRGGLLTAFGSGVKSIDSGTTKDFPLRGGTVDLSQAGGPITLGTNNNIDYQGGVLHPPKRSIVSF